MPPGATGAPGSRLGPAAGVRQAELGTGLLLVNLHQGDYLVLDAVARAMWEAFIAAAGDRAGVLSRLQAQYAVDADRLAEDLDQFLAQATRAGLLHAMADGPAPPPGADTRAARPRDQAPRRWPGLGPTWGPLRPQRVQRPWRVGSIWQVGWAWRAWWTLWRTARALDQGDASVWALPTCPADPATATSADDARLPALLAAFRCAECGYLSRRAPDDCLPRSLALVHFLRRAGVPAVHRIGFDRTGTGAHAWVELAGQVLLDRDRRARLVRLAPVTG